MTGAAEQAAISRIGEAPYQRLHDACSYEYIAKGASRYKIVAEEPQSLASAAGVSLEVYSLARMIASEDFSTTPEAHLALAEAARNRAANAGITVFRLLTRTSSSFTAISGGRFSEQAAGKWAATTRDPTYRHVVAAIAALSDGTDFIGGAYDFFDPVSQNAGVQAGHVLNVSTEQYINARYAEGLSWVGPLPGIAADHLMIFGKGGGPSLSDAIAAAGGAYEVPDGVFAQSADTDDGFGGFGSGGAALALVGIGAAYLLTRGG